MHSVERGSAKRLVGLALSFGSAQDLLKRGLSEEEIGLTQLRADAERILGYETMPWYLSYRIRVGIVGVRQAHSPDSQRE